MLEGLIIQLNVPSKDEDPDRAARMVVFCRWFALQGI